MKLYFKITFLLVTFLVSAPIFKSVQAQETRLLRQPSISNTHITFTYGGDVWVTKIDGTAKGGALISIANKFEIPISYVGLGESIDDLIAFNSQNFARSILNLEEKK